MHFRIQFGSERYKLEQSSQSLCAHLPISLLDGQAHEDLGCVPGAKVKQCGEHYYLRNAHHQIGLIYREESVDLARDSEELYLEILNTLGALRPVRMWNYVPEINRLSHGLEKYRLFCLGRSLAFEQIFKAHACPPIYPAASAVGSGNRDLCIYYFASKRPLQYFENLRQIPAHKYPRDYGPRAPSFSRASVVHLNKAEAEIYISGTAAVVGHSSEGRQLSEQLNITIENLKSIYASCLKDAAEAPEFRPYVKIYLRDERHLGTLMKALKRHERFNQSTYTVLKADICRSELEVEIEVSIRK